MMIHHTYIPRCFELDFVIFKQKHGKSTSRQLCKLIRESLDIDN